MKKKVELTPREHGLLKKWMSFYADLASGARQPTTVEQEHFVEVARGAAVAETEHEVTYAKWLRLEAKRRRDEEGEAGRALPAFDDRQPGQGWFTDADWKKMHPRRR